MDSKELVDFLYYKKLPEIYRREDNLQKKTPLYRYLQSLVLGGYGEVIKEIDDITTLIDPQRCPAEFFPYLYKSWGLTYDMHIPLIYQRKILENVGNILRRRGTYACVRYLVRVLTKFNTKLTMTHYSYGKILTITLIADTMKALEDLDSSFATIKEFVHYFIPYNIDILVTSEVKVQSLTAERERATALTQGMFYDIAKLQNE